MTKTVILFSGHYLQSKRKAGFHWLAYAYHKLGWQVIFVTCPISYISHLRKDHKFQYPVKKEANKLKWVEPNLGSYVYFTKWHPVDCRNSMLNRLSSPFFASYGKHIPSKLTELISKAGMIILESNQSLILFEHLKQINNNAKFVYRVSDDVRLLRYHPLVRETEDTIISKFDLVSTSNMYLYHRMKPIGNVTIDFHGIKKDLFDKALPSPYKKINNAIFVGNGEFDYDFLKRASSLFSDWNFHIIGPIPHLPRGSNIHAYGELPFTETVPYLKHADIGLQIRSASDAVSITLADSLKVIQYTYCKLPIIAPDFMKNDYRHNMFYYASGDNHSIKESMLSAMDYRREDTNVSGIHTWEEIAQNIWNRVKPVR